MAAFNSIPENADDKSEGVNVSVAEPLTFVEKSPPQNGVAASGGTFGAGGLGEGTPKVCVPPLLNLGLILGNLCFIYMFFNFIVLFMKYILRGLCSKLAFSFWG